MPPGTPRGRPQRCASLVRTGPHKGSQGLGVKSRRQKARRSKLTFPSAQQRSENAESREEWGEHNPKTHLPETGRRMIPAAHGAVRVGGTHVEGAATQQNRGPW